jgi:hypothetical protein
LSNISGNEIIFEYGDWKITTPYGMEGMFFDKVYHKCPWKENWLGKNKYMTIYAMVHLSHCSHCGEEIPDSIMGVWKLKNFDMIQNWTASPSMNGFYLHNINKNPTSSGGAR